jgi:hypothetical protein
LSCFAKYSRTGSELRFFPSFISQRIAIPPSNQNKIKVSLVNYPDVSNLKVTSDRLKSPSFSGKMVRLHNPQPSLKARSGDQYMFYQKNGRKETFRRWYISAKEP